MIQLTTQTMTTNNHTLAVREALHQSAGAAEKQLSVIGHEHGDSQLALIVGDLTTPEILVMTEEFDMTKPSLVSAFLTEEQFSEALESKSEEWWHYYGKLSPRELSDVIHELRDKIENFLCPVIYSGASAREGQMLDVLFAFEHGHRLVYLAGLGRKDFDQLLRAPDERQANQGTWQSLLLALRISDPKEYEAFAEGHFSITHIDSALLSVHTLIQELAVESTESTEVSEEEFINF